MDRAPVVAIADDGVRANTMGSRPVWGPYAPLSFPKWAAKFFVDAMWVRAEWGT
jgi:hypothetical protein